MRKTRDITIRLTVDDEGPTGEDIADAIIGGAYSDELLDVEVVSEVAGEVADDDDDEEAKHVQATR